jgi:hypothetical protein
MSFFLKKSLFCISERDNTGRRRKKSSLKKKSTKNWGQDAGIIDVLNLTFLH